MKIDYTYGLSLQNGLKMNSLRLPFTNLIDRSKQTITKQRPKETEGVSSQYLNSNRQGHQR